MSKLKRDDCVWPDVRKNGDFLGGILKAIPSPYSQEKPPFCYPGTVLRKNVLGRAHQFLAKQINAIGSHTQVKFDDNGNIIFKKGEGGFEVVQKMEAQAIWLLASLLGGEPNTVDGYFCGGGTEANIEGLWIGREFLKNCPDPNNKGIVLFTTPLLHYSLSKAASLLGLGEHQWLSCTKCGKDHIFMPDPSGSGLNFVGINDKGEMSIECLEKAFQLKYDEGFRRFLIAPTVGTSVMGSIDPICDIAKFIKRETRKTGVNFYMHVDASFAGFTIPFISPDYHFAFQIPEVMSVTIDGDKMGQLPYPSGIFLCRKGLMSLVARKVNYVRGNEDNTISGSRSGLSPVLAWYLFQTQSRDDQRDYVQNCLENRDYLVHLIEKKCHWIKLLPRSPWVNFAPMIIPIDTDHQRIPEDLLEEGGNLEAILEPYHLRSDDVPSEPEYINSCPYVVYKICIMPHHTRKHIEGFVEDLEKADKLWHSVI